MSSVPILRVHSGPDPANVQTWRFSSTFHIGRATECELQISDSHISRKHALVSFQQGQWWIQDLNSANGILLHGQRVPAAPINPNLTVRLGLEGPWLWFEVEPAPDPAQSNDGPPPVHRKYSPRLERPTRRHQTMMIRTAFAHAQKKQRSKFALALGGVALAALAIAGYALYQHRQLSERKALAQELFYQMKALDVDIASVRSENVARYRAAASKWKRTRKSSSPPSKSTTPK
jgi:hypothetical protein